MRFGCSYFGSRITPHVAEDMKYLADCGFDYVVHTYSENDHIYHHGTMTDIVGVTKNAGLDVYIDPWGVLQLFGGEAFSHWVNIHTEIKQVSEDGTPLPAACPNNRKTLELMSEWAFAAAKTGADSFFWDEPHMYNPKWFNDERDIHSCFCPACQERYESLNHRPISWIYDSDTEEFKRQTITDFLFELARMGRQTGLKNSVCLLPSDLDAEGAPDWNVIASMEDMDCFGTDPYWLIAKQKPEIYVARESRKVLSLCEKYEKDHMVWLQGFHIPEGKETEVGKAFNVMAACGVKNIAFWGFRGCKYISRISCGNPDIVWEILLAKIKEYKA